MKLAITREQQHQTDRKGRSQGVVFTLQCHLELDDYETELVEKHRKEDYPLGQATDRRGDPRESIVTLDRLRYGFEMQTTYVSDALSTEDMIKEACSDFKELLGTLDNYGGGEEIEY